VWTRLKQKPKGALLFSLFRRLQLPIREAAKVSQQRVYCIHPRKRKANKQTSNRYSGIKQKKSFQAFKLNYPLRPIVFL